MKKEKVTTNKVTSKLEKVLWAVLILMFIVSLIGMFLGQYMDGNVFYKMCVIMTVLAAAILSAERFYFGKEMGRDMPEAFKDRLLADHRMGSDLTDPRSRTGIFTIFNGT